MTSSVAKFVQLENLNISGTKKDITKRKKPFFSTLKSLLSERIFGMSYFSGHIICTLTQSSNLVVISCFLVKGVDHTTIFYSEFARFSSILSAFELFFMM